MKKLNLIVSSALSVILLSAPAAAYAQPKSLSADELKSAAFSSEISRDSLVRLQRNAENNYDLLKSALPKAEYSSVCSALEQYTSCLSGIYTGSEQTGFLAERTAAVKEYCREINWEFISADPVIKITGIDLSDGLSVDFYEWVLIEYSENGATDICGYGFNHTVKIFDNKIISDTVYDDEFAPLSESDNASRLRSASPSEYDAPLRAAGSYTYSADKAVEYADKYALNYNTAYGNYNSVGGDCANFVSQCLYTGGFKMTDGWFWKSQSNYSSSWTYVPTHIKYFSQFGTFIRNASESQIKKGNPVYYFSSAASEGAHTSICVGENSGGTPVINAHNNDRYRVNWKLGGEKYWPGGIGTIQLNASQSITSAATTVKPTAAPTTAKPTAPTETEPYVRIPGDANGDKKVDSKDVLVMRKKIAEWNVTLDENAADCNADGKLDSKDVILLRKHIAKWKVELK